MTGARTNILHRPALWLPPILAAVILVSWWLAWMVPQGRKVAAARVEQASQQQTYDLLQARIAQLRVQVKHEQGAEDFLKTYAAAIPDAPDAAALVVQVYRLATGDGVKLESISDNEVDAGGDGYSTIPVSLTVSGPQAGIVGFVAGLYELPRLVTIGQLSLMVPSGGDVVLGGGGSYQASITATAYTTAVSPAAPTAATPSGSS